jgi:hypothetical protein
VREDDLGIAAAQDDVVAEAVHRVFLRHVQDPACVVLRRDDTVPTHRARSSGAPKMA